MVLEPALRHTQRAFFISHHKGSLTGEKNGSLLFVPIPSLLSKTSSDGGAWIRGAQQSGGGGGELCCESSLSLL